jgi:hypothetical protein
MLKTLASDGASLVRQEIRLARIEIASAARSAGTGAASAAAGAVLLLLGALALITALVMLAGDQWLADRYWLAALIVAVVAGGGALWMAMLGRRHLSPDSLLPDETAESLKESSAWLKRQLTSGGTSS